MSTIVIQTISELAENCKDFRAFKKALKTAEFSRKLAKVMEPKNVIGIRSPNSQDEQKVPKITPRMRYIKEFRETYKATLGHAMKAPEITKALSDQYTKLTKEEKERWITKPVLVLNNEDVEMTDAF